MHAAPLLPPELYDAAIDHLWDDPKALAACALTCRSWVGASRLHRFRTVRIQNDVPEDLDQWVQRLGRAGRSRGIPVEATMIIPISCFQTKGSTTKNREAGWGSEERVESDAMAR